MTPALRDLEKRLEKEPENLPLRVQVAGLLRDAGRTKDAIEQYWRVAVTYRVQGRYQQAIAVCRNVLEWAPGHDGCTRLLADLEHPVPVPPTQEIEPLGPPPEAPIAKARAATADLGRVRAASASDAPKSRPASAPVPVSDAIPKLPTLPRTHTQPPRPATIQAAVQPPAPAPRQATIQAAVQPPAPAPRQAAIQQAVRSPSPTEPPPFVASAPPKHASPVPVPATVALPRQQTIAELEAAARAEKAKAPDKAPKLVPARPILPKLPKIDPDPTPTPTPQNASEAMTAVHPMNDAMTPLPHPIPYHVYEPTAAIDKVRVASDSESMERISTGELDRISTATLKRISTGELDIVTRVSGAPELGDFDELTTSPPVRSSTPTIPRDTDTHDTPVRDTEDDLTKPRELVAIEPIDNAFFLSIPPGKRDAALRRCRTLALHAGDAAIRKGQHAHPLILVIAGRLEVRLERPDGRAMVVDTIEPGQFVGEAALLHRTAAASAVVAMIESTVLALPQHALFELAGAHPPLWAALKDTAERRARRYDRLIKI